MIKMTMGQQQHFKIGRAHTAGRCIRQQAIDGSAATCIDQGGVITHDHQIDRRVFRVGEPWAANLEHFRCNRQK